MQPRQSFRLGLPSHAVQITANLFRGCYLSVYTVHSKCCCSSGDLQLSTRSLDCWLTLLVFKSLNSLMPSYLLDYCKLEACFVDSLRRLLCALPRSTLRHVNADSDSIRKQFTWLTSHWTSKIERFVLVYAEVTVLVGWESVFITYLLFTYVLNCTMIRPRAKQNR